LIITACIGGKGLEYSSIFSIGIGDIDSQLVQF